MKTRALALMLSFAVAGVLIAAPKFEADVLPYFQTHCLGCHGEKKQEGDFRIDKLSRNVGKENVPQWAEVMERISSGEMPPKKVKTPPAAKESAVVVEWLAARIKEGEAARMAQRGRVSYNRLTREEYVNTVRSLIGVHFDATDPSGFPEDPEWHGFERLGSVLTLSPSNIEKYLAAAEVILAEAYPAKKPVFLESSKRAVPADHIDEPHRERLRDLGLLDKVRFEMWAGDIFRGSGSESLPEAGIYEISYTLSGLRPEKSRAPRLLVYENSLDRVLFEQDILAPEDKPITVTFRAHLPKGRPNINVINNVPGLSNNFRSGRHANKPFISTSDGRVPWQMKLTDEQGRPRYPFLILDSFSWRGPFITEEEQRRRDEYWPSENGNLEQVRTGLGKLGADGGNRALIEKYAAEIAAAPKDEKINNVDSLLIGYRGKLIFESYYRRGRANFPHYQMSITKSYTAMAVGRAIQLGLLKMDDLDKPAISFLKELDIAKLVAGADKITLAQAMQMSSGIRLADKKAKGLIENPAQLKGQGEIQAYLQYSEPIPAAPRAFKYQEPDTAIAMQVLSAVAPGGAEEFIKNELLKPMSITQYHWESAISGLPKSAAGSSLLSRDMLKFGQLILNKGKWQGQQLIPEAYLARATTPSQVNEHYGFFWWVDDFTVGGKNYHSFQGRGAGGQFIFMFPELDLVAVVTSHNKGMGDTLKTLPQRIIPAFVQK